jgi:hypothetical protein
MAIADTRRNMRCRKAHARSARTKTRSPMHFSQRDATDVQPADAQAGTRMKSAAADVQAAAARMKSTAAKMRATAAEMGARRRSRLRLDGDQGQRGHGRQDRTECEHYAAAFDHRDLRRVETAWTATTLICVSSGLRPFFQLGTIGAKFNGRAKRQSRIRVNAT